ncbi:MAG: trigger factor [Proteobacteria bacterium]|nr:trigger factor [Pseudomonadota bacterium]
MQITETLNQGLKREFDIIIPAKDINSRLNTRLEAIGKRVKIPGFRPGKTPLSLLKQRYQAEALGEVIESCVDKAVKQAVQDHSLKLALKPNVTLNSYEEGKDLTFHMDLEVLPTINEIKLDGLSFEKHVVTIPSEQIADVLKNLANRHRESRPLQKPRKSKKGDVVIIDFKGFVDDKPIEGGEGQDYALELGSGSFIPGFEDQLIGHDKGMNVEVKVTFPKEYHEKRYANKPARFDVTIKDIHELPSVAIDVALAEKLGFKSLKEMEAAVEANLSKDYMDQSFLNTKRHVLDALAERFTFDVPQKMIDLEFDNIWIQLLRELGIDQSQAANMDGKTFKDATGKSEDDLRKDYKVIAERRVRLGILLAEIGNRNNISVSNQELMEALTARAREFPGQEREVFDFYRNNESALATLRAPLFENKVVDFILEKSKLKEIHTTPEELEKILIREEEEAEKKISQVAKKPKKQK